MGGPTVSLAPLVLDASFGDMPVAIKERTPVRVVEFTPGPTAGNTLF